jgi:hypothetical protein
MAIEVSCPSCKSEVHVDDALAGKDILCPNCQQRVTVPSIAAGRPEALPGGGREPDEADEDRDRGGRGRASLPRYQGDEDYDLPRRSEPTRWNATLSGLSLLYWSSLVMGVLMLLMAVVGLVMGGDPQRFMMGNPGQAPAPEALAFGLGMMAMICVMFVLFIVSFVGMCMCCTVPSESGAKGRAISAVVLVVLTLLLGIIVGVAAVIQTAGQMQRGGAPPPPGQMPFSPTAVIVLTVVGGFASLLIATLWLMFHKAIADYFQNSRLSKHAVWYTIGLAFYLITGQTLQYLAKPGFLQGDLRVPPNQPFMTIAQVWGMLWMVGLTVWYLYIVRETRRTILEEQPAADRAEERDEERDY